MPPCTCAFGVRSACGPSPNALRRFNGVILQQVIKRVRFLCRRCVFGGERGRFGNAWRLSVRVARGLVSLTSSQQLHRWRSCRAHAGVAELADAPGLGPGVIDVKVQVLSPAPSENEGAAGSRGEISAAPFLLCGNSEGNAGVRCERRALGQRARARQLSAA
jgi:hypothetical protein